MELTVVNKLSPQNRTDANEAFVRKHLEAKLAKIELRWGKPVAARVTTEALSSGPRFVPQRM